MVSVCFSPSLALPCSLCLAPSLSDHWTAQVPPATFVCFILSRGGMSPAAAHLNDHDCCPQHMLFSYGARRCSAVVHCRGSPCGGPIIHWYHRLGSTDVGVHVSSPAARPLACSFLINECSERPDVSSMYVELFVCYSPDVGTASVFENLRTWPQLYRSTICTRSQSHPSCWHNVFIAPPIIALRLTN